MPKRRFAMYDLVHIAKDLGSSMSHFTADVDAIVLGTYASPCGGSDYNSYSLYVKDDGPTSWYYGEQLTLIQHKAQAILKEWKTKEKEQEKLESSLDWIFANGPAVIKSASGYTIEALARKLGIANLWGWSGEGFTYWSNAQAVMHIAKPFLRNKDKNSFLKFAATQRKIHA